MGDLSLIHGSLKILFVSCAVGRVYSCDNNIKILLSGSVFFVLYVLGVVQRFFAFWVAFFDASCILAQQQEWSHDSLQTSQWYPSNHSYKPFVCHVWLRTGR